MDVLGLVASLFLKFLDLTLTDPVHSVTQTLGRLQLIFVSTSALSAVGMAIYAVATKPWIVLISRIISGMGFIRLI